MTKKVLVVDTRLRGGLHIDRYVPYYEYEGLIPYKAVIGWYEGAFEGRSVV